MSHATMEAAQGKWKGILATFGIDPAILIDKQQKCPFCGGKDRWRWDDKDGAGTYFCNQCGAGDGLKFLMNVHGWDAARAYKEVDGVVGSVKALAAKAERSDQDKRDELRRVWKQGKPITPGSPAWIYLERRCGSPFGLVSHLRIHPGLHHSTSGGLHPVLLAATCYPSGKVASIHRTFLDTGGQKAAVNPVRMMMPGSPLKGSSVPIGAPQERLGIAEGIETAMCAGKLFGLPVWSAISANGMIDWEPPKVVRSVLICGDNDANFTGQKAAFTLANRLRLAGIEVEVQIPPVMGTDWCDVWGEQWLHEGVV